MQFLRTRPYCSTNSTRILLTSSVPPSLLALDRFDLIPSFYLYSFFWVKYCTKWPLPDDDAESTCVRMHTAKWIVYLYQQTSFHSQTYDSYYHYYDMTNSSAATRTNMTTAFRSDSFFPPTGAYQNNIVILVYWCHVEMKTTWNCCSALYKHFYSYIIYSYNNNDGIANANKHK